VWTFYSAIEHGKLMVDPMKKSDIIIFAPHPDDEALGCAGLIYKTVQKNKKVKIVIVANGHSRFHQHRVCKTKRVDICYEGS
jgi:LmbE family N-acetylglucosaminyl deacetylase